MVVPGRSHASLPPSPSSSCCSFDTRENLPPRPLSYSGTHIYSQFRTTIRSNEMCVCLFIPAKVCGYLYIYICYSIRIRRMILCSLLYLIHSLASSICLPSPLPPSPFPLPLPLPPTYFFPLFPQGQGPRARGQDDAQLCREGGREEGSATYPKFPYPPLIPSKPRYLTLPYLPTCLLARLDLSYFISSIYPQKGKAREKMNGSVFILSGLLSSCSFSICICISTCPPHPFSKRAYLPTYVQYTARDTFPRERKEICCKATFGTICVCVYLWRRKVNVCMVNPGLSGLKERVCS